MMRALLGVLYEGNGPFDARVAKAAGADGVIFKALQGTTKFDSRFSANVKSASAAGLPWTAGAWPDVTVSSPQSQANTLWFIACSVAGKPPLPLSLDLEDAPAGLAPLALAGWYRAYIDHLTKLAGRKPHIYTLDNYWNTRVAPAGIDFSDCDLRTADYRGRGPWNPTGEQPPKNPDLWEAWLAKQREPEPDAVTGFPTWASWQFSADGNGLGSTFGLGPGSAISINVVKDDAWFRWFPADAPPPPPPPQPLPPVVTGAAAVTVDGQTYRYVLEAA